VVRLGAIVLALAFVAGCLGATPTSSGPTSATTAPPTPFDGPAALQFAKGLALGSDGAPRYRIPGTQGQADGAADLWQATGVAGWTRTWQNFTGADYLKLDRDAVTGYTEPSAAYDPPGGGDPRGCTQADHDKVAALPFSNLLAVHRSATAGAPLFLVGAHWDSQMHSDEDADHAKRDLPDPGANDGASGVGVLLQLQRHLATLPDLPFSVGLLFIDGEDGYYDCYPDAGSLFFAQTLPTKVDAFLLLDMVGDPSAIYPRESFSVQSAKPLMDLLWRHGQAADGGRAHFSDRPASIDDDHVAFLHEGIPAADLIDAGRLDTKQGFPPQWDTTGDTVDKLDAGMLGRVGDVLAATLADPAFSAWLRSPASA
jgi:hypothetical protein